MRKIIMSLALCALLFTGCGKSDIAKTYEQSEDTTYQFRLKLDGRMPNSELDSCFVVLTNNENLTFEEVSKSLYSSSFEDIKVMEGSLIVEMIY